MNSKQAAYVLTISEQGSITAAAKILYISQSSLSQTLQQLESDLGTPIFNRSTKPLRPTYIGEKYLKAARELLAAEENLKIAVQDVQNDTRGYIRLGISPSSGMALLPLILPAFYARYPKVEIALTEAGSVMLEEKVLHREVDIAFISALPHDIGLTYNLVAKQRLHLLASANTYLAQTHPSGCVLDLSEAENENFISMTPNHSIRNLQDRIFYEYGISPRILIETSNIETAIQLTFSCNAVMLCPERFSIRTMDYFKDVGNYYLFKNDIHCRHFYVCYRRNYHLPRYALYLMEVAKNLQIFAKEESTWAR